MSKLTPEWRGQQAQISWRLHLVLGARYAFGAKSSESFQVVPGVVVTDYMTQESDSQDLCPILCIGPVSCVHPPSDFIVDQ